MTVMMMMAVMMMSAAAGNLCPCLALTDPD